MNRLRQLAHYLRTQSPSDFYMGDCARCALATAARMPEFRLLGVYDFVGYFRYGNEKRSVVEGAAEFFGISTRDMNLLFCGAFDAARFGNLIFSRDAAEVAAMVDALADKYGEPPLEISREIKTPSEVELEPST
jgi:hypothetical protein